MSHGSTSPRRFVLASLTALAVTACGDPEPSGQQAAACGDPGSWPVVRASDTAEGRMLGLVGGRVVALSRPAGGTPRIHAAGTCGEDPVQVELIDDLEGGEPVVVDGNVLVLADDAAHYVDLSRGTTHPTFGAVLPQMYGTSQGVLALGIGGKLFVHPDPASADVEPTLLLDGVSFLPRPDDNDAPPWPHLWTDGMQTFGLSLTFELMRIDLAGGEPQVELTDVEEFHILDGGTKAAWRGLGDDMLHVTDLGTDEELLVTPQNDTNWNAQEAGRWALVTTDRGRLLNLDTGALIEPVDFNPVDIRSTTGGQVLVVGNPNGSTDRGYWLIGSDGMLSNFLPADACLGFDSKILDEGIVVPEGACDPQTALYNPVDVMELRPFDGSGPRTLAQRFGFVYEVLEDDSILSWEEVLGTGVGALSADSPDGEPIDMAAEVTAGPWVIDGLDVYYVEVGQGVQRFAL